MRKLLTLLIAGLLISGSSLWGQTTNITISAQVSNWTSTGVTITPEMAVTIEATGEWCGAPWSCYGPEGTGGIAPSIFLAPGLSSGGLVGKVGNNSPFFVGSTCSFNGQDHGTGTLYLAFNDEITGYYNNSGSLDVTITTTEQGSIELVGQYTDKPAYDLKVRGDYAYVTTLLGRELYILDISDPEAPNLIGTYTATPLGVQDDQVREVALIGDYAYTTRHWGGFEVIDVSDPTMPTKVGPTYSASGVTMDFVFSGNYGFLASREGGVHVYDVSDPANPVHITTYSTSTSNAWASSITVNGNYLYIGIEHSPNGFEVFDISNPAVQNRVATLSGTNSVFGVAVSGDNAFLGLQYSGGLKIADVSTPTSPSYVGSGFSTHGEPWGITVSGNTAFLGERSYGLQVLDISDIANPTLLDEYDTGGDPHWGIAVVGDYVYLADGPGGVKILSTTGSPQPGNWQFAFGNWSVNGDTVCRTGYEVSPTGNQTFAWHPRAGSDFDTTISFVINAINPDVNHALGYDVRVGIVANTEGDATANDHKWSLFLTDRGYLALLEENVAHRALTPYTPQEGIQYNMRMQIVGYTVNGKVWQDGDPEPNWMVTDNFAGPYNKYGVGVYAEGADVCFWLYGEEPPQDNPPQITLTYPVGFEIFTPSSEEVIQWQTSDDYEVTGIDILFSDDNGDSWDTVATSLLPTASYGWLVPNLNSDRCKIRIRATDNIGQYAEDTTDENFMICDGTSPSCSNDEVDAMGPCPTEAIVGDGKMTANFSKDGRLVALWYPTPGAYNQIKYLTGLSDQGRCKRFLGAPPHQGSFAGVRIEGERFSWLMNSSWNKSMNYNPSTTVLNIEYHNKDLQLRIIETCFIPHDMNTLVRHYDIVNEGAARSVDFVYYGEFNVGKINQRPEVWLEPFMCAALRAVLNQPEVTPFKMDNANNVLFVNGDIYWSDQESDYTVRMGLDREVSRIMVQNIDLMNNDDYVGVYSDYDVISYEEPDITAGMYNGFQEAGIGTIQEFDSAELTVYISCGSNYSEATANLTNCRNTPYPNLLSKTERGWESWLGAIRGKQSYSNLNEDEKSFVERWLVTLRMLHDRNNLEEGGIVASPNLQPQYYGCFPRDGVFQATALALAGYHGEALSFYNWLFNSEGVLQGGDHWLQTYSTADGEYLGMEFINLLNGEVGYGVVSEDQMPIVLWGLWVWTEITGQALPSNLETKVRNVAEYIKGRIVPSWNIDPYKYAGLLEPSLAEFEVPMLRDCNGLYKKEKFGVAQSLWTNCAAVAGLKAAANLLNDTQYNDAADEIKYSIKNNLSSPQYGYFTRRPHILFPTLVNTICGANVGDPGRQFDPESNGMYLAEPFFSVFDEDCDIDTERYRTLIDSFLRTYDQKVFMPQYFYSAIHDYIKYGDATLINRIIHEFTTPAGYVPDTYELTPDDPDEPIKFGASRPLGWTQALGVIALLLKGGETFPLIDDHSPCKEVNLQANYFINQLLESVSERIGNSINQGEQIVHEFINEVENNLAVLLNWNGSELKLRILRPDGSLYREIQSTSPPIFLIIPAAGPGRWKFEVTGIDVPNDFYPYVLAVGEPKQAFGSVTCNVSIGSDSVPAYGVAIDVTDGFGILVVSGVTDENGKCEFDSLGIGDYIVTIVSPLGYQADKEDMAILVMPDQTTPADFVLTPLDITPQQRSRGYWAHQLHKALKNKPKDYTLEDFSGFVGLINVHFNQNQVNPVDFYSVPQPANQTDSLNVLKRILHMRNTGEHEPFLKRLAKSQLMALMLNVVSGKVSQTHEISADGRTVSQLITYCNMLVGDEIDPSDDNGCPGHGSPWFRYIYASFMLVKANLGLTVPGGMIPEDVIQIAYKQQHEETLPTEFALHQNYPNPFNPVTEINFALPNAADVKLDIFNIMGQKVATVIDQYLDAGKHSVTWDGSNVSSGVYFYRIQSGDLVDVKKMILLK